MKQRIDNIVSLLIGGRVIERLAAGYQVKPGALRALGMVSVLLRDNKKVSARGLLSWLDCSYAGALAGVNECIERGWMFRQTTIGNGLKITLDGALIVVQIERADREARAVIKGADLPVWKRAYNRKALGKRAAKRAERLGA